MCLDIDASNSEIKKILFFKIAKLHFDTTRNYSSAIRNATFAFNINSNFVDALVLRAESYYELKMFFNASADCEMALKFNLSTEMRKTVETIKKNIHGEKVDNDKENIFEHYPDSNSSDVKNNNKTDSKFYDSTYSCNSSEIVNNRSQFRRFFGLFSKKSSPPPPTEAEEATESTRYSFTSADAKNNSNFKEYVEKPKPKAPQKSHKELQNEIKADNMNKKGCQEFVLKRYQTAVKYYSEALVLCPKNVQCLTNRAAAYMAMEKYHLAVADALKAVEVDPSYWKGYLRSINCFLIMGDIKHAGDFIKKCEKNVAGIDSIKFNEIPKLKTLTQFDDNVDKHFKDKSYQECLKSLDGALKIAKCCIKYRDMKTECLIMLEKFDEATQIVNAALQLNPRDSNCIFLQGLGFYRRGELSMSIEKFEGTLRVDPDHERAKQQRLNAKKLMEFSSSGELFINF